MSRKTLYHFHRESVVLLSIAAAATAASVLLELLISHMNWNLAEYKE